MLNINSHLGDQAMIEITCVVLSDGGKLRLVAVCPGTLKNNTKPGSCSQFAGSRPTTFGLVALKVG